MANEKEEKESSGSNKLLLIILIVVLIIAIGVGVFVALMLTKKADAPADPAAATAAAAAPVQEPMAPLAAKPQFHKMDPFVLSLQGPKRSRFLQIKMTIMSRREGAGDVLDAYMPWIRNIVVKYLSGFSVEEAIKPDATDHIRKELLTRINALLDEERTGAEMDDLLITDMVIQ